MAIIFLKISGISRWRDSLPSSRSTRLILFLTWAGPGKITPDAGQRQWCAIDESDGGIQQSILSVFVETVLTHRGKILTYLSSRHEVLSLNWLHKSVRSQNSMPVFFTRPLLGIPQRYGGFVLWRQEMSDLAMKILKWQSTGDIGISSATLASIACGLKKNIYGHHFGAPHDAADFRRCVALVEQIQKSDIHSTRVAKRIPAFKGILNEWDSPCCSAEVWNEDVREQSTRDSQENQWATQGLTMESHSASHSMRHLHYQDIQDLPSPHKCGFIAWFAG